MLKVIKRDNTVQYFDQQKIINAITQAMRETIKGVDQELATRIAQKIEQDLKDSVERVTVADIQERVETELMNSERKEVAKVYILYREQRDKLRELAKENHKLLTDEFISKYKHLPNPFPTILGQFVFYRTYSRWLPLEKRREYWWETVRRAVEFNCNLVRTSQQEAEALYDNIYHLRQFLAGRTLWTGGTEVSLKYPMSNFNCSFTVLDKFSAFKDLFYLLMIGAGVGVRVLKSDVEKLPKVRTNIKIIHEAYSPVPKEQREDLTSVIFQKDTAHIIIGDSKEGWVEALDLFLNILSRKEYRQINTIIFNYDQVRPKGERLKTFGGTASGYESLERMFSRIDKIVKNNCLGQLKKLKPVDCLDIANIIGQNVVVGGVRRTSEVILFDSDDQDILNAKNNLYELIDGKWVKNEEIDYREMSNNSIFYTTKPSREKLSWHIQQMRYSGEPGFMNAEAAAKRRPNLEGANPCMEVLLDREQMCNLTTVNVLGFVQDGKLEEKKLMEAQRLSVRAAFRMTFLDLELDEWDIKQKRDRLVGCSLTGWQDMVNATNMSPEEESRLRKKLREVAHREAESYARKLGVNPPLLVTTVKPEGTLSQLPTVSSGVHYSHAPYFIRRVRINASDPLLKVCEELGYDIKPENGQTEDNCRTKVISFPCSAPPGKTKKEVSAIQQLENYRAFQKEYTDHNTSITVHVRNEEWEEVEEWLWNNWDDVVAVSFVSLDDSFYAQMPYEEISREEYERRVKSMVHFIPSLISKYEKDEITTDPGDESCESGICPIR
ncbi:MAG: ribonucleoside-triphosphate reductase, adenosylcobalamin-dependent [Candidatus Atribacteria bacterium]|nr:ribonucleoside-triphosphate reductase, adenosylcobalamin-dependent [Candidatus Atribacteria bacterium]